MIDPEKMALNLKGERIQISPESHTVYNVLERTTAIDENEFLEMQRLTQDFIMEIQESFLISETDKKDIINKCTLFLQCDSYLEWQSKSKPGE